MVNISLLNAFFASYRSAIFRQCKGTGRGKTEPPSDATQGGQAVRVVGGRRVRAWFSSGCFGCCRRASRKGAVSGEGSLEIVGQDTGGDLGQRELGMREECVGLASGQEGEGGTGARELGMREQVRAHFRNVRKWLAEDFPVSDRVVHWDGPSVRPKFSSMNGASQVGSGEVGVVDVGAEAEFLEAKLVLEAIDDDFAVFGNFAMARVGGEQYFGTLESIQLILGGAGF